MVLTTVITGGAQLRNVKDVRIVWLLESVSAFAVAEGQCEGPQMAGVTFRVTRKQGCGHLVKNSQEA